MGHFFRYIKHKPIKTQYEYEIIAARIEQLQLPCPGWL
jgi:hypothetical protein